MGKIATGRKLQLLCDQKKSPGAISLKTQQPQKNSKLTSKKKMPRSESKSKGRAHPRRVTPTMSAPMSCLLDIHSVLGQERFDNFVDFLHRVKNGTVGGKEALVHMQAVLSPWPDILQRTLDLANLQPPPPPRRLSPPSRSSYVTQEEMDLLLDVCKVVWYKGMCGHFHWMQHPRLHMQPERVKKGVKIICEWDSNDKGVPQYYDAEIVRKHKKNGVMVRFLGDPNEYCLTYRGGKNTPKNRMRDIIFAEDASSRPNTAPDCCLTLV